MNESMLRVSLSYDRRSGTLLWYAAEWLGGNVWMLWDEGTLPSSKLSSALCDSLQDWIEETMADGSPSSTPTSS